VSWNRFVEPDSSEAFDAADFAWAVTEDGITNGCCMLKLTPSDMVKIGRLYRDVGRWQGQQIVLVERVQLATLRATRTISTACLMAGDPRRARDVRRGGTGWTAHRGGAANSDGDHCEQDTHPDGWLDTDDVIYMLNTVITPVRR
jgi:hypothetical protein